MTKKQKLANYIALTGIQGANALIPIVIFPYLFVILGATLFARFAIMEAVALYILSISLYSFEITSVQRIIEAKKKGKAAIAQVYFETLYARIILLFVAIGITLSIFLYFYPSDLIYAAIWMALPLGHVLQSSYYYQAMEENVANAIIIVCSRAALLLVAYFFISDAEDLILAHSLIPASYLISGLISVVFVKRKLGPIYPSFKLVQGCKLIGLGWTLFVGNIAIMIYRGSNVLILTAVSGNVLAISIYAMAEKMVKMLQALSNPLSQLYFPRLVTALSLNSTSSIGQIWKYTKPQIIILSIVLVLFDIFAYLDAKYWQMIFRDDFLDIFLVMSFTPLFGVANFMFGLVGLSMMNKPALFARGTTLAGLVSIATCSIGGWAFSAYGAAAAFSAAEIVLFVFIFIAIRRA